ncbi:MAG: seg [Parcubacteria group bacterium]|nr:seg [Parcubacteria group bacterium]
MGNDFLLFVGILIFFFVLWFASGGPTKPISFAGPYITPITDVGDVQSGYDDGTWKGFGGFWNGNDEAISGSVSSYRDQVYLDTSSDGVDGTRANTEYLTIEVSSSAANDVSLSGWRLVSDKTGTNVIIPQGRETPRTGNVNQTGAIVLHPGDRAIVSTGSSPIGVSFRENACVGYLGDSDEFTPELYNSCPSATDEYYDYYDGNTDKDTKCSDYVNTVDRCETPRVSSSLSRACKDFVSDHLNYNGCVKEHGDDRDFKGDTWRVYLGQRNELWKSSNETIRLVDPSGKTVDLVSY